MVVWSGLLEFRTRNEEQGTRNEKVQLTTVRDGAYKGRTQVPPTAPPLRESPPLTKIGKTMKIIRLLWRKSWELFVAGAIAGAVAGASSAGIIATINYTIQNLDSLSGWLPWGFVVLCLLLLVSATLSIGLMARLSQKIVYQLRLDLADDIFACSLQHLEKIGAASLLAVLTNDVQAIANSAGFFSVLIVNIALILGCLIYLCWLSPIFMAFFLIFMVMAGFSYQLILTKGYQAFSQARQVQDRLFQHFRTITEGTKELKLHRQRRRAFTKEDLRPTAADFCRYKVRGITIFGFANAWGLILFFMPIGALLYIAPQVIELSPALISSCALTILYMINPIRGISNALPVIAQANISLSKIESMGLSLAEQAIESDFPNSLDFTADWKSLQLVDLTHTYKGEEAHQFSLQNINLQFKPGEIVFIVGGNGSGKSTLVKLLTGLYIPDRGKILFDEQVIDNYNREWYRQQFSVVFYDFYLFERLLGIESANPSQVREYLTQLEIAHKVTINNGVLSTTNLSQGQRKRLALLTAYLEDRPIYVFDEWASDQDPVFKKIFYHKLLPKLKQQGKTVIAVTHDDRYFNYCDRLIKLEYGCVVN